MSKASLSHLYKGSNFDLFEVVVDGKHLLQDFIVGLSEPDQRKVSALLKRAAEHGPPRNEQKFKSLGDGLFEFKSFQVRIFCAFRGKSVLVLTHGIKKKKDKHDKQDMLKANEILAMLEQKEGNL
jgi:phage-related protein